MYNFDLTIKYDDDDEYREQILKAFDLSEYADEITKGIDSIYEDIRENSEFGELLEKAANSMLSEDRELGLVILFSYDHFPAFHECIKEFKKNNIAPTDKINNLKEKFIKK
mgnify:CR=1 FL=1|tara:strand:- start:239 stop:571 length:333 start_codon:yes stop_codon:yes gene_type:complete